MRSMHVFLGGALELLMLLGSHAVLAGEAAPYLGEIRQTQALRICRIFPGGECGPWVLYTPSEGGASCTARGFDAVELAGPPFPCGSGLANGAAEGGVDPFCPIGNATPGCPLEGSRRLFGTFGQFACGSSTNPLNPPAYAVGQEICGLDFAFIVNHAAGTTDPGGHVIGHTFIEIVWHSTFNATSCATAVQPLVGDIVDGIGLDFGPAIGPAVFFTQINLSAAFPPPLPVMPPPGGAYSFYYWNTPPEPGMPFPGGALPSANNAPLGWGPKDPDLQGSSGPIGFVNLDFSLPVDDNGSQYELPTECANFSAGSLCPQPDIVPMLRLGVAFSATAVSIVSANPPLDNPYLAGTQPFRDVLQNTTTVLMPQGIGIPGTPDEGLYTYASIAVTFSGTPVPAPTPANISVICTDIAGNGNNDCPAVAAVTGSGNNATQVFNGATVAACP